MMHVHDAKLKIWHRAREENNRERLKALNLSFFPHIQAIRKSTREYIFPKYDRSWVFEYLSVWVFFYNQLQKWWDTPTEKRPFLLQIAPGHRSVKYNTDLPPPSHSKLFLQVYGLVLFATLIRGGGGITSTRSWTGHLCQNTAQCLKYFCNWL